MFDLAELERAHEIVGQAVPATPAHAWPLLAERLGAHVVVNDVVHASGRHTFDAVRLAD